jgi:uncharacterized membrane protein YjfL (UPF0719 family)
MTGLEQLSQIGMILLELVAGFGIFWVAQAAYQYLFRRWDLNLELFVRDNVAVAIALVGYYFGIVIALAGVFDKAPQSWLAQLTTLVSYGAMVVLLMLAGAWVGDRWILRHCDAAREIQDEQNTGAAAVEAGIHIANGLILSSAIGGQTGTWWVALVCWLLGLGVLVLVSRLYPLITRYSVFGEIRQRNNPAAGVALAGLLIATGNIVRIALRPEFDTWSTSLPQYGILLGICLLALAFIHWLADWVLVPGVKISDEIVNQAVPNLGVGFIAAFAYIGGSFLIGWAL